MFLKFGINFSIYLERGKFQQTGDDTMFYFGLNIFSEIFMHFWKKIGKKKIYISWGIAIAAPPRPLIIKKMG